MRNGFPFPPLVRRGGVPQFLANTALARVTPDNVARAIHWANETGEHDDLAQFLLLTGLTVDAACDLHALKPYVELIDNMLADFLDAPPPEVLPLQPIRTGAQGPEFVANTVVLQLIDLAAVSFAPDRSSPHELAHLHTLRGCRVADAIRNPAFHSLAEDLARHLTRSPRFPSLEPPGGPTEHTEELAGAVASLSALVRRKRAPLEPPMKVELVEALDHIEGLVASLAEDNAEQHQWVYLVALRAALEGRTDLAEEAVDENGALRDWGRLETWWATRSARPDPVAAPGQALAAVLLGE